MREQSSRCCIGRAPRAGPGSRSPRLRAAAGRVAEFQIPFAVLGATTGDRVAMFVVMTRDNARDRPPATSSKRSSSRCRTSDSRAGPGRPELGQTQTPANPQTINRRVSLAIPSTSHNTRYVNLTGAFRIPGAGFRVRVLSSVPGVRSAGFPARVERLELEGRPNIEPNWWRPEWRTRKAERFACYRLVRSSLMMFSSAVMISSFSTFDFLKLSRRSKDLVGGLKAKTKYFGRPAVGFAVSRRTASRVAVPWPVKLLDERDHLLLVSLTDDLQERRLGRNVGQPT